MNKSKSSKRLKAKKHRLRKILDDHWEQLVGRFQETAEIIYDLGFDDTTVGLSFDVPFLYREPGDEDGYEDREYKQWNFEKLALEALKWDDVKDIERLDKWANVFESLAFKFRQRSKHITKLNKDVL